jgi:hypothetical protein
MRAAVVFLCSILLALMGAMGHYIFAGLPGSSDYIPSDPSAAVAAGVLIVVAVGVGVAGLIFFASC